MKPVTLLSVKPGDKVLDLCAAPGGKSTQIASYLKGEGFIVSNEIIPSRTKILSQNIERMGITNAIVLNENPTKLNHTFAGYFDKILVDAPCSGEGMFRKNDEALKEWSVENVNMCAARQDEILDCAADMLKSGGTMVYSTCTFSREEDEDCMTRFMARHPDYEMISAGKLFPHRVRGEGHFMAALKKTGSSRAEGYSMTGRIKASLLNREQISALDDFTGSVIKDGKSYPGSFGDRLVLFGDNLYLVPDDCFGLGGLKILRAGLQLGSFIKGRFEPAHAWAMALKLGQAANVVNITYDEAKSFIAGMTLNMEGKKGWYLVCYSGISLGWGKLSGGILKNHYPRGLRRAL